MQSRKWFKLPGSLLAAIFLIVGPAVSTVFAQYYVIVNPRGVGTEIKSLPYTITQPGSYYITRNLQCPAESDGITIKASDVTLDLMGFKLEGEPGSNGKSGIYSGDIISNVEVRNGTIEGFSGSGILFSNQSGTGLRALNIRSIYNDKRGIFSEWHQTGFDHMADQPLPVIHAIRIKLEYTHRGHANSERIMHPENHPPL